MLSQKEALMYRRKTFSCTQLALHESPKAGPSLNFTGSPMTTSTYPNGLQRARDLLKDVEFVSNLLITCSFGTRVLNYFSIWSNEWCLTWWRRILSIDHWDLLKEGIFYWNAHWLLFYCQWLDMSRKTYYSCICWSWTSFILDFTIKNWPKVPFTKEKRVDGENYEQSIWDNL